MITELLCTAVALGLYLNTLDADFCYDDRYVSPLPSTPTPSDPPLVISICKLRAGEGVGVRLLAFLHVLLSLS
ncbi:hypothetical protein CgunFtcFv8_009343 [Champsocephalus gunnari]|uniref:Secreted protein n=1 Tax=Champsocephalus gunnari TaxID=52237 RepID=A0AAN8GXK4_CHAGU|nr:hypothetical protein CgunFtcFv8_009343 [Champsocephalus gunnari]